MKKTFNKGESHQRFSIRKLSIGVASVLVGSTFMVISGEQVHADETNVDDASQKTDDNASEDQSDHVKVQSDQQDVVVTKKDQILDTADASATAKEEPKAEDITELKVSENVANNAKNVTTSDADVKNNVVSESKVATKDSQVTEQDYLNALGYGEMELSDEQLAKLGLTRDTYIDNGVKYKAKGILDISLTNGSTLHFDNVQPPHADNGSMLDPNEVFNNIQNAFITNWDQIYKYGIGDVDYTAYYVPYVDGKTIYINKGTKLTNEDAERGIPGGSEDETGYKNVVWDKNITSQVDVNQTGTYDAAVDITYINGLGVSAGVKVVVVDLTGKDEYTHIGADIPAADKSVDGAPAGSQIVWTTEPSTEKAGKSVGTVTVTYPDGNKGTAKSTLNVLAPDVKDKVEVWQGDPVPDPDKMVTNEGDIASHLPGTTYTWETPVDTTVLGNHDATIITHWPDGKTTSSPTVIVVNKHTASTDKGTKKTITRDIYTQLEGQEPKKVDTQTVTLTRSATEDLFTHEITYGEWSTANMAAYTAPSIENYTVENPDAAPAVEVTGSTDNMSVTFKYKANHQEIVDGDGTHMDVSRDIYTQLEGQQPTKVDTETVTLHRTGDKNLATGEIKWNAWQSAEMPAYAAPEIKNYTVQNPNAGAAVTANGSTAKLADVVFDYKANHETITTGDGTEKTVSRDIYTQIEGQDAKKVDTETVTLHRTGDKNLATGEIKWNAWQSAEMPAYTAPEIKGYFVTNPDAAPAVTVDGSKDSLDKVVFHYNASDQKVLVNYVDEETHKTITSTTVNGKTGETVQFNAESHVPAGWTIVKGQTIPTSFTFGSTPLKDQTILIHHNENDRYKVSIPDGENVTTHVGANENVPSLSASGVKLVWTEDGKQVSAPAGVNVAWETVPATDKITTETGTLKITFKDGTTTTVNVPVNVQGATAGDLQTVDQGQTVPAAKTTVNTTTVDHFGITNVDWSKTPSTATPGAAIPGVARVHYSDGTYQDVNVVINVRGVEDGRDHKDDSDVYMANKYRQRYINKAGKIAYKDVIMEHYRIKYTDYAYPVGNPNRVTYSAWKYQIVE